MFSTRLSAILLIAVIVGIGFFVFQSNIPFQFGLDLSGGTELVYEAGTSELANSDIRPAMQSLRDVIERRVNLFGVSEPIVQTEGVGQKNRLIVELPGVTDLDKAIELIGKTPTLEFMLLNDPDVLNSTSTDVLGAEDIFEQTGLTGRLIKRAQLEFSSGMHTGVSGEPLVLVEFTSEGRQLFADVTRENVGSVLAIFLDGQPISLPVINEEINNGQAQISGSFTPEEARELVRDLNFGALPVPISLASNQSIGPSLGGQTLSMGIYAGLIGLAVVVVFLLILYRLSGLVACLSLLSYVIIMLGLFKLIPVTLTASGIAGFILSVGMAVDANILIFERIKEELSNYENIRDAIREGFKRAWVSIRDANVSSFITAVILFWFGTSLVKGFALVFGIGILVSMFTAIALSRFFLLSVSVQNQNKLTRFLLGKLK